MNVERNKTHKQCFVWRKRELCNALIPNPKHHPLNTLQRDLSQNVLLSYLWWAKPWLVCASYLWRSTMSETKQAMASRAAIKSQQLPNTGSSHAQITSPTLCGHTFVESLNDQQQLEMARPHHLHQMLDPRNSYFRHPHCRHRSRSRSKMKKRWYTVQIIQIFKREHDQLTNYTPSKP